MHVDRMTDEEEIRALLARFCHLLDDRRFDEWSELFLEDAISGTKVGRPAIIDSILAGQLANNPEMSRKHMNTNIVINVQGDVADVLSDIVLFTRKGTDPFTIRTGQYRDRVVRVGDKWMFSERQLRWQDNY